MPGLISKCPDYREDTREVSVQILTDFWGEPCKVIVQNGLETVHLLKQGTFRERAAVGGLMPRVSIDSFEHQQERVLGCDAEHYRRREDTAGFERLHCLLQV